MFEFFFSLFPLENRTVLLEDNERKSPAFAGLSSARSAGLDPAAF
jgi:hypothetical protein